MLQAMSRYFLFRYQKAYYEFKLKYVWDSHYGNYHAYIVESPDYGSRNASTYTTHRMPSADGYYISWSCPVRTLEDMNRISETWCMATVLYIVHGGDLARHFDNIVDGQYTTKIRRKKPWMWLHYKYRLAIQSDKNKKQKEICL